MVKKANFKKSHQAKYMNRTQLPDLYCPVILITFAFNNQPYNIYSYLSIYLSLLKYLLTSILEHPGGPVSITHRRQIPEYIHLIFFNCPLSSSTLINFSELRGHLSRVFCINTRAPGGLRRSASGLTSSSSG